MIPSNELARQIAEQFDLSLKGVRRIVITLECDSAATMTIERFVEGDIAKQLVRIVHEKYELHHKSTEEKT